MDGLAIQYRKAGRRAEAQHLMEVVLTLREDHGMRDDPHLLGSEPGGDCLDTASSVGKMAAASRACITIPLSDIHLTTTGTAKKAYRNVLAFLSAVGLRENDVPQGHQRIRWTNVSALVIFCPLPSDLVLSQHLAGTWQETL